MPELLAPEALAWLGEPTPELVAAAGEKRRFVADLAHWPPTPAAWADVRAEIAPALERFDDVERALSLAHIPAEPGYLAVDDRTLRATFRFSNRLRARYTTVDFLEGQGTLERVIDAMLDWQG